MNVGVVDCGLWCRNELGDVIIVRWLILFYSDMLFTITQRAKLLCRTRAEFVLDPNYYITSSNGHDDDYAAMMMLMAVCSDADDDDGSSQGNSARIDDHTPTDQRERENERAGHRRGMCIGGIPSAVAVAAATVAMMTTTHEQLWAARSLIIIAYTFI